MTSSARADGRARRHLALAEADNVTTLLDDNRDVTVLDGGRPVAAGIPFGHKAAIAPIAEGEAVVKYGVPIGVATAPIDVGEHVHVHNCR